MQWGQRIRRPVGGDAMAAGDTMATANAATEDALAAAYKAAAKVVTAGDAAATVMEKDKL